MPWMPAGGYFFLLNLSIGSYLELSNHFEPTPETTQFWASAPLMLARRFGHSEHLDEWLRH